MQEIYDEIYKYNEICDNMCDEYRDCSDCIVCKFKNKYDINIEDNCEAVYIAIHLLGYNANTAEYIKEQYKNMKSNLCAKRKCDDCFIFITLYFSLLFNVSYSGCILYSICSSISLIMSYASSIISFNVDTILSLDNNTLLASLSVKP